MESKASKPRQFRCRLKYCPYNLSNESSSGHSICPGLTRQRLNDILPLAGYKLTIVGQKHETLSMLVNGVYTPNTQFIIWGAPVMYKQIKNNTYLAIFTVANKESLEWRIARVNEIGFEHLETSKHILSAPVIHKTSCRERYLTDVKIWKMASSSVEVEVAITASFAVTSANLSVLLRDLYNEHRSKIGMHCLTRPSPALRMPSYIITHTHRNDLKELHYTAMGTRSLYLSADKAIALRLCHATHVQIRRR